MHRRRLGTTGIVVSEIGFGAWGIGGRTPGATSYGVTDDTVSRAALRTALARGITFFDTANVYGAGRSELLLGEALAGERARVVLATKAGRADYASPHDYTPDAIRRSLEGSLERLGTDHVDLLQLHGPSVAEVRDDGRVVPALERLRNERLVRAWGISVASPADGIAAIRELGAPVVQVNLNLLDQRAVESGLLALAAERGTGVIARTPLCFGFLAGTVSPDTVFAPDDHRSRWPREQIVRWIEGGRRLIAAIADREGQTPAQVALRFCLSCPAVASVIPGMLTPVEVEENAAASALGALPASDLSALADAYREHELFAASASG